MCESSLKCGYCWNGCDCRDSTKSFWYVQLTDAAVPFAVQLVFFNKQRHPSCSNSMSRDANRCV